MRGTLNRRSPRSTTQYLLRVLRLSMDITGFMATRLPPTNFNASITTALYSQRVHTNPTLMIGPPAILQYSPIQNYWRIKALRR